MAMRHPTTSRESSSSQSQDGATRNAASERNDHDEHEVFDAQLDDVELWGFDRAVFHGPRGAERLCEPMILDAVGQAPGHSHVPRACRAQVCRSSARPHTPIPMATT